MNHNEAYSICAECNFPLEKRASGRGYNFVTSPLLLGTFRFHDRTCMRNYLAKTPMFNDGSLSHVLFGSYPNYDLESKRILLMNSGFSKEEAISLLTVSKPIGYIELNVEKCIPLSKTTSSVLMKYQDCDPSHLYIMHLFLNEIDNLSINYNDSADTFVRTKTATDILTNLKHMVCALKDFTKYITYSPISENTTNTIIDISLESNNGYDTKVYKMHKLDADEFDKIVKSYNTVRRYISSDTDIILYEDVILNRINEELQYCDKLIEVPTFNETNAILQYDFKELLLPQLADILTAAIKRIKFKV